MPRLLDSISWRIIALAAVFLIGIASLIWVIRRPGTVPPPPPFPPQITVEERQKLFNEHVLPNLGDLRRDNRDAVDHAVKRIDDNFARYRAGVPKFAEDLTSMSTRFGILRRMPTDWWNGNTDVKDFVREKFEDHVFSPKRFTDDLVAVLADFRGDLEANRNRFFGRVRASLNASQMPEIKAPDVPSYSEQVNKMLVEFSTERATDSVQNGLVALVGSEAASLAAEQLLIALLDWTTISIAAGGTTGGATAAGAAAGGTTGSLGGPVGTAIGVAAGLAVGIAVDWYLTDRFEAQINTDLGQYLAHLHVQLIDGTSKQPGLRRSLEAFTRDLSDSEEQVIHNVILGS